MAAGLIDFCVAFCLNGVHFDFCDLRHSGLGCCLHGLFDLSYVNGTPGSGLLYWVKPVYSKRFTVFDLYVEGNQNP